MSHWLCNRKSFFHLQDIQLRCSEERESYEKNVTLLFCLIEYLKMFKAASAMNYVWASRSPTKFFPFILSSHLDAAFTINPEEKCSKQVIWYSKRRSSIPWRNSQRGTNIYEKDFLSDKVNEEGRTKRKDRNSLMFLPLSYFSFPSKSIISIPLSE